MISDKKVNR